MALKYSRQREAIKERMMGRTDHPTADTIYMEVRNEFPNISLGTVYRNLTLLSEMGEIARLNVGDGAEHFDPNTSPHCHFVCKECGCVQDLGLDNITHLVEMASESFDGKINGSVTYFYGICGKCLRQLEASAAPEGIGLGRM